YAKSKKWIETNPALDFDLPAPPPRQQVASPEARAALLAAADDAGEPNMALAMLLGWKIGQREGDLLRTLQTQYVEIPAYKLDAEVFASLSAMAPDGRVMGIRLRQGKTRVWVEVPVVAEERKRIEAAIDAARSAGIAFFDTAPFYGFGLSERRLGDALRGDSGLVVSSKVGRLLVPDEAQTVEQ
ncbi:aldo/keto reductase, partial [Pseudomonas sp. JAI120]|uniref:aldo/keto reductase n=1 Tax=Pseudomonas sp. JAI120 TaxID=2723063 RepID=UPI0030EF5F6E